jgi:hypothetical protein
VVPSFGVDTVKILFAQGDEADGAIMIMEDLALRGVTCLRAVEPIEDFRLAAGFLSEIARIHARWWDAPELADGGSLDWVAGPGPSKRSGAILQNPEAFAEKLTSPRAVATPRLLKDPDRLLAALRAVSADPFNFPLTITHSGLYLPNVYVTADNRPGFLDWNLCRAPWAKDVAIFIVTCLDPVDRRRWEAALLQHYLDALAACGVGAPGFDLAWHAYRAWPIWPMVIWLLNRTDWHPETTCAAITSRCAHAMLDLDTFGALGV